MNPFTLHRHPSYFSPLPDTFWPDRWLPPPASSTYTLPTGDSIPSSAVVTDKRAFIPFSAGHLNCAGRVLAMKEMRDVIGAVVRRFRSMSVGEGDAVEKWEERVLDIFVQFKGPLVVRLEVAEEGR